MWTAEDVFGFLPVLQRPQHAKLNTLDVTMELELLEGVKQNIHLAPRTFTLIMN